MEEVWGIIRISVIIVGCGLQCVAAVIMYNISIKVQHRRHIIFMVFWNLVSIFQIFASFFQFISLCVILYVHSFL